jgi:hypothetical protein
MWITPDGQTVPLAAEPTVTRSSGRPGAGAIVAGGVLILIGAWALVARFVPDIHTSLVWPFVSIVLGAGLVVLALVRPSRR